MAKYIVIEEDSLEDYVDILLQFATGINPHLDEYLTKDLMLEYLAEHKLTGDAANELGDIITHLCIGVNKPLDC